MGVGLCPELQEVFSMTMTTGDLPFRSKRRRRGEPEAEEEAAVDEVELQRRQEVSRRSA
jgi:hypothetical protein